MILSGTGFQVVYRESDMGLAVSESSCVPKAYVWARLCCILTRSDILRVILWMKDSSTHHRRGHHVKCD